MPYRRDKISDVIVILTIIKREFVKRADYYNPSTLRKEAIKEFAETELKARRYKNEHSAIESLRDACTRRLSPNIMGIRNFDDHVNHWLRDNSMTLKDVLLRHSKDQLQEAEVRQFFESRN